MIFFFVLVVFCGFVFGGKKQPKVDLQSDTSADVQEAAALQLIERWIGDRAAEFEVEIVAYESGRIRLDHFELVDLDPLPGDSLPRILIRGSSGVALSSGFYWYLKYFCNSSISWGEEGTGDNINIPTTLPRVDGVVRINSPVQFRYYMNVCTNSYSMAWWKWERWEKEIDWMAMNGINLPLSFTATEYVMRELFRKLGVERNELNKFFPGPAFLAWHRMGNLRAWAGPLSDEWLDTQADLQRLILKRQRAFGMISVLPGFAGFVPEAVKSIYPSADIQPSNQWWQVENTSLCCNYLLRPEEAVWKDIGVEFYRLLAQEFGTDHAYNCDMFNEMQPLSDSLYYLRGSSQAVIDTMLQADDKAVWIMQGWLFYAGQRFWQPELVEAYLSGVPNDRMIILDLMAEAFPIWRQVNSFFGKPFIWCFLHNFGALRGMYGNLTRLATDPVDTMALDNTMVGTGLTMEAIEHNPVAYELMNEMGWRSERVDVSQWLRGYVHRRYGVDDPVLQTAWQLLLRSVYSTGVFWKSYINSDPFVDMQRKVIGWFWMKFPRRQTIDTTTLVSAWRLFAQAADEGVAPGSSTFEYDLIDVTLQATANLFFDMQLVFEHHFHMYVKNRWDTSIPVRELSEEMLKMIELLDELLASNVNFLLGRWVEDARSWSEDPKQQELLQFNALNLITLWGPTGEINDYSARAFAGLYKDYYYQRWKMFFDRVNYLLAKHQPQGGYRTDLFKFKRSFGLQTKKNLWATKPIGNTRSLAISLAEKYAGLKDSDIFEDYSRFSNRVCGSSCRLLVVDRELELWTHDLFQLQYICSHDHWCAGFDTAGRLWQAIYNISQSATPNTALYIKKSLLEQNDAKN